MQPPDDFNDLTAALLWRSLVIGLVLVAPDGTIKRANPAFCNLVEFVEAELIGIHFKQITHPEDIDADVTMLSRLAKGQDCHYIMRKRYLTKTGRTIWIKLRVDAIYDPDGGIQICMAQIAPIEQQYPPRFPGDVELEAIGKKQNLKVTRWMIFGGIGAVLSIAGAIIQEPTLIGLGSTILLGGGGAALAESKESAEVVAKK